MNRRLLQISVVVALVLGAAGALSACGQKGPLYLPGESQEEKSEKPESQSFLGVAGVTA